MKHRYIVYLLILSLLAAVLCVPASAKSVFEYDYDISYDETGDTLVTIHVPLDTLRGSVDGETPFDGPSCTVTFENDIQLVAGAYNFFFMSPYIDYADLPDSTLVSLSATWSCNKSHTTPEGGIVIEYNCGEKSYVDIEGTTITYIDTYKEYGELYPFVSGVPTYLGAIPIDRGESESFSIGIFMQRFMALSEEPITYTISVTNFDVTFHLEDAYLESIEKGKTNQLLEDLKDSNKEISDKLDQIANALEPAPGAGEGAKEEAAIQGGMIDDLNGQMNQLNKPNLSDQGSISDIISPGDLTSYTTFLASMVNAPYISSVVMLALILSLAAYVLFGKRG